MRYVQPTGDEALSAPAPAPSLPLPGERFTRVFVTVDACAVILLAFAFGFGNGWTTATKLGVNAWIAPLAQPAVDLAVVGLMIALRYLSIHGWTDAALAKPRRWLRFFGLLTLAMNCALPLGEHHFSRAAWDAIGPVLLIAWSELAPWLLRAIYTVRDQQHAQLATRATIPDTAPEPAKDVREEEVQPSSGTVTDINTVPLAVVARDYMIAWDAKGRTYSDGLIPALYKVVTEQGRGVTQRRVGQVCQQGWDLLYTEGRVHTPRVA